MCNAVSGRWPCDFTTKMAELAPGPQKQFSNRTDPAPDPARPSGSSGDLPRSCLMPGARRSRLQSAASCRRHCSHGHAGRSDLAQFLCCTPVADDCACKRIGGRNTRRPACADRREDLHQQGKQDYGQEISQPSAHRSLLRRAYRKADPPSSQTIRQYQARQVEQATQICCRCEGHRMVRIGPLHIAKCHRWILTTAMRAAWPSPIEVWWLRLRQCLPTRLGGHWKHHMV